MNRGRGRGGRGRGGPGGDRRGNTEDDDSRRIGQTSSGQGRRGGGGPRDGSGDGSWRTGQVPYGQGGRGHGGPRGEGSGKQDYGSRRTGQEPYGQEDRRYRQQQPGQLSGWAQQGGSEQYLPGQHQKDYRDQQQKEYRDRQQRRELGQQSRGPEQQPRSSKPHEHRGSKPSIDPSPSMSSQRSQFVAGNSQQTLQKYTPKTIQSLDEQMMQMTIIPKKNVSPGVNGRKIRIETNHLYLNLGDLKTAYHFDVQFDPDKPKFLLRSVMEEFRRKYFPDNHPAFDGKKNLYSPYKLVSEGEKLTDEIRITDEGGRERTFKVQVQFANAVDLTILRNIRMTILSPQEATQCVEIVLRSAPAERCIQIGRSFFTRPLRETDLGEGMEMYPGFYQSVVRGSKPLLNVDVAHKPFPKQIKITDLIIELCSSYYQRLSIDDLYTACLTDQQIATLSKFLTNLRILYEIADQPGSKREYSVNGIDGCPKSFTFQLDGNGPAITIEEYYKSKKNYRIRFPLMPTIWVGNKNKKVLLPAELCTVLPGQNVNRRMTDNQTREMIKRSATSTKERKDKICRSLDEAQHNRNPCIQEFGFSISSEFEQILARVLVPPTLEYDAKKTVRPSKGVWRPGNNFHFLDGAEIKSWIVISACGMVKNIRELEDQIYSFGPSCGMHFSSRAEPFEIVRSKGRQVLYRDIEACLQKCSASGYDLIFVIIPDSGRTYSDVKKAAELRVGCLTQCIRSRTMKRLDASTINNILLKVNSKLNGTNHCLNTPPKMLTDCMLMGADVTHPRPESSDPSVAAVTASHDLKDFRYNICCRLQPPTAEIIGDLQEITREHLNYYKTKNGKLPSRIIFFRDGVSEGQFPEVIKQEVQAVRSACYSLEPGSSYKPKITFLVVQKRHHTRFFPKDLKDSEDKNMNVPAGTCVDTDITNPMMQDFYLVSHASIQGVAKPTKYCTLWDDNDMSNDDVEELTYYLCHMFTRCNRSVSYPAPTYYAHLAAARAKVYIENENIDLRRLDLAQRKINILDTIRKQSPMFFV